MNEINEVDFIAMMDDAKKMMDSLEWFLWRKNTVDENRHWLFKKNGKEFDNATLQDYKE